MIDFHSHILPGVDDGPGKMEESLAMLRRSFLQGVDLMVSTSHFYADQEYPQAFLQRRNDASERLQDAMLMSTDIYPKVALGAEVLYFPGISQVEETASFKIGTSPCILIEPPMTPWSDEMLDEITALRQHFHCVPVIAHVDRYMNYLNDATLIERVRERDLVVQVNAAFFLSPKTVKAAVKNLKNGMIQLIGSDCHNLTSRRPNLGQVKKLSVELGLEKEFQMLHKNAINLLLQREES